MIFMFGIGLGLGMFIPWVIGEGNMDKMGVGLCMASGFAMILGVMMKKEVIPFAILGYVAWAFFMNSDI